MSYPRCSNQNVLFKMSYSKCPIKKVWFKIFNSKRQIWNVFSYSSVPTKTLSSNPSFLMATIRQSDIWNVVFADKTSWSATSNYSQFTSNRNTKLSWMSFLTEKLFWRKEVILKSGSFAYCHQRPNRFHSS